MNIERAIKKFAERERYEAEQAKNKERNQICIDPDSYIAKEIKYQTALLHEILYELRELKKARSHVEKMTPYKKIHKLFDCKGR